MKQPTDATNVYIDGQAPSKSAARDLHTNISANFTELYNLLGDGTNVYSSADKKTVRNIGTTPYTTVVGDLGTAILSNATNITLAQANTVPNGYNVLLRNTNATNNATILANATDNIDAAATLTLPPQQSIWLARASNTSYTRIL